MGLNRIFKIEKERISVETGEFKTFPDLKNYTIAYIGKHKAISPSDNDKTISMADIDKDLLIECRLFNENEEIYVFPKNGIIKQRTIRSKEGIETEYIDKIIQLKSWENEEKTKVCTVRHYIGIDGYTIQRYIKID